MGEGLMGEPVYWLSKVPDLDDLGNPIHDEFVDGATIYGPWALMTPECHSAQGRGLGTGRGQRYKRQPDGRWLKIEG